MGTTHSGTMMTTGQRQCADRSNKLVTVTARMVKSLGSFTTRHPSQTIYYASPQPDNSPPAAVLEVAAHTKPL